MLIREPGWSSHHFDVGEVCLYQLSVDSAGVQYLTVQAPSDVLLLPSEQQSGFVAMRSYHAGGVRETCRGVADNPVSRPGPCTLYMRTSFGQRLNNLWTHRLASYANYPTMCKSRLSNHGILVVLMGLGGLKPPLRCGKSFEF